MVKRKNKRSHRPSVADKSRAEVSQDGSSERETMEKAIDSIFSSESTCLSNGSDTLESLMDSESENRKGDEMIGEGAGQDDGGVRGILNTHFVKTNGISGESTMEAHDIGDSCRMADGTNEDDGKGDIPKSISEDGEDEGMGDDGKKKSLLEKAKETLLHASNDNIESRNKGESPAGNPVAESSGKNKSSAEGMEEEGGCVDKNGGDCPRVEKAEGGRVVGADTGSSARKPCIGLKAGSEGQAPTKEEEEQRNEEAFSGVGGAFFNNDKINQATPEDDGGADVCKEKTHGDEKRASIDESKNESHYVNKSYKPDRLSNIPEGSMIGEYRKNDEVAAEGWFFKKRVIFSCFWHRKYFVLLDKGILVYHKEDGRREAKGNWDITKAVNFRKYYYDGGWIKIHPYRLIFDIGDTEVYFGYDTAEVRDFWHDKLEEMSRRGN